MLDMNSPEMLARLAERLTAQVTRLIGDAGKVLDAIAYEEAKGGGWAVILDTEYAALKTYYAFRNSPGVRFGESTNMGGWFVSVRHNA